MKPAKTLTLLTTLLALPAFAADPYEMPDDAWISLSGEVESVYGDSFTLDYGEGLVTVEMDDWDWYAENYALLAGDNVTVSGVVDDDLFEVTSIEASSVYVESLGSYFYASPADEEDYIMTQPVYTVTTPIVVAEVEMRGTVKSVGERQFTLETGTTDLTVDTSNLAYNPLDDEGFQQIEKGDRVLVNGMMDSGFFGDMELDADYTVTLSEDSGK
ncbi:MAG TPA: hypothetical protein VJ960_07625 [Oceanipulchritudo sp.]|nr:hypothetical protein [Oceanipulchritudo sp.]